MTFSHVFTLIFYILTHDTCLGIQCYTCATNFLDFKYSKNLPKCNVSTTMNCSKIDRSITWSCLTYTGIINKTTNFEVKECFSDEKDGAVNRKSCRQRQNHLEGFHCNICDKDLCNNSSNTPANNCLAIIFAAFLTITLLKI